MHDLRTATVTLTPSGEEMAKRVRELYAEINSEFGGLIESEHMAVTAKHLEQVHSQLMKRLNKHR